MKEKTLIVEHAQGQYPILIGNNIIKHNNIFADLLSNRQVIIISNETVASLYLQDLINSLPNQDQINSILLPDGEQYKTFESYCQIVEQMAQHRLHRDAVAIALGGGVIGDMTGFAAATYQRGIDFIQIPTTLLAQVDASIGGKTAVNLPQGKNLVGAFHQPQAVIIDINTLATLTDRHYVAALAEVIKAALIRDPEFFNWLEANLTALLNRDNEALTVAIEKSCQIKRDIVVADEKEKGERALLNLGHTFGHAIEQIEGYGTLLHGEAVAIGIVMAAKLSHHVGWIMSEELTKIVSILTQAGLPTELPSHIKYDTLHAAMLSDKKILDNQLRLVLLKGIGEAIISSEIKAEEIHKALF